MDASWIAAFLLFTSLQGTEQHPIIDDSAEFFDVFPGGESTDPAPTNVTTSDEISASYISAGNFHQSADTSDISLESDCSLLSPGCNSTAPKYEKFEFLQNTTETVSNITIHSEETDATKKAPVPSYMMIAAFFIGTSTVFIAAMSIVYAAFWVRDKCCNADLDPEPQIQQISLPLEAMDGVVYM